MARGHYPLALVKLYRLRRNYNLDDSQWKQVTRLLSEGLLYMGNYRAFLRNVRYIDFQSSTFLKEGIIRSLIKLGQRKKALMFLITYSSSTTWNESVLKKIYPELEVYYQNRLRSYFKAFPNLKVCNTCHRPMIYLVLSKTGICRCSKHHIFTGRKSKDLLV
jgi:hypothetical protein